MVTSSEPRSVSATAPGSWSRPDPLHGARRNRDAAIARVRSFTKTASFASVAAVAGLSVFFSQVRPGHSTPPAASTDTSPSNGAAPTTTGSGSTATGAASSAATAPGTGSVSTATGTASSAGTASGAGTTPGTGSAGMSSGSTSGGLSAPPAPPQPSQQPAPVVSGSS